MRRIGRRRGQVEVHRLSLGCEGEGERVGGFGVAESKERSGKQIRDAILYCEKRTSESLGVKQSA